MNTLDSRILQIGNCFAVKFTAPGAVRHVLSAGAHAASVLGLHAGFPITVGAKTDNAAPSKVHYLEVTKQGDQLVHASTEGLAIEVGDTVLWHTSDSAVAGFSVAGAGKDFNFGNGALKAEAIYTHAFGTPGTYEWVDLQLPNVSGTVVVKEVSLKSDKDRQDWLDSLSHGAAFEITGGKVTPSQVEIVVGQTVFWKASDGEGLVIVDKRLL